VTNSHRNTIAAHMDALTRLQAALTVMPYNDIHEHLLLICLIRIQLKQIAGYSGTEMTMISEVESFADFQERVTWLEQINTHRPTAADVRHVMSTLFISLHSMAGSIHRQIDWHRPPSGINATAALATALLATARPKSNIPVVSAA
jgi:hypothetical protein